MIEFINTFKKSGIWPCIEDIFREPDFAPSFVTDRTHPSNQNQPLLVSVRDTVEAFRTVLQVFKKLESIDNTDGLTAFPIILREDAARWWQGVRTKLRSGTNLIMH